MKAMLSRPSPVCFEVILEMSRPGEGPAAALKRAAEDLPGGEGAPGPRRRERRLQRHRLLSLLATRGRVVREMT